MHPDKIIDYLFIYYNITPTFFLKFANYVFAGKNLVLFILQSKKKSLEVLFQISLFDCKLNAIN